MIKKMYYILVMLLYTLVGLYIAMLILDEKMMDILSKIFIVCGVSTFLLMVLIGITDLINYKKIDFSFSFVRNIKLVLIPFYLFFGIIGLLLLIGFVVPFLWVILALVLLVGIAFGYVTIIITGLPNIIKLFKLIIIEKNYDIVYILLLISQFIFVFDVIGSIILSVYKKQLKNNN